MMNPLPKSPRPQTATPLTTLVTIAGVMLSVFIVLAVVRPNQDNFALGFAVVAILVPVVYGIGLVLNRQQSIDTLVHKNYAAIQEMRAELISIKASVHAINLVARAGAKADAAAQGKAVESIVVTDAKIEGVVRREVTVP